MLQDIIHPQEQQQQLPTEDIPSPISGPNFYFSDNDLFSDALQNSEVTSSNCCGDENSSYGNNLTVPPDIEQLNGYQTNNGKTNSATATSTSNTTGTSTNTIAGATAATATNNNNLSIIFDSPDEICNDISASIDFSQSPSFVVPPFLTQQDQFELSLVPSQIQLPDVAADHGLSQYATDPVAPLLGPPLPSLYDEDCLSSVPSYVPLNPSSPSCSFLAPAAMATFMPAGALTAALSADSAGIFAGTGSILIGSELQPQDLEFQADNAGIFFPDSVPRVFKPEDFPALSSDNQQLVGVATTCSSTPLVSEISSLEDSTFNKVGKLSVEQRKEKIHRYMKKRNERNFSKKIKYACRKTLADSRPRVRGRFAKNDDFGETHRQACSNHEEEDDDEVAIKEEDDMVDSSDIFAHISGVNSLKCNYPIQSWI